MERVKVSIIIVNFNTFDLTCQCLQSIHDKSIGAAFEIIVVDNNSTDSNPTEFEIKFPGVRLIMNRSNVGFAKANNQGIKSAKGKYILLLNSDAVLQNDAPGIVLSFLEQHNDVAVATCRLEYPNGNVQHNCQRFPSIKYQLLEIFRLQKIFPGIKNTLFGSFFDYLSIAYPDWVWGTFFMFRRELLLQLPDEKLADEIFMYGEDMQWCMDFKKLNYKIAFVPEARVVHYLGASKGNKDVYMKKNLQIFMKKHYTAWERKIISILGFLISKTQ